RARRARRISRSAARRYARTASGARRTLRRLRGSRRRQLGYVLGVTERLALKGRLTSSRMPAVFLLVRRNASYWGSGGFASSGAMVRFRGSEMLFQHYPGRGLQLQPLVNWKRANLMHGACVRSGRSCSRRRLARLIAELGRTASRRSPRFIAWEYFFYFGGGSPPWMSGMAQATAVQALGRAAKLLDRPDYLVTARKALPAFSASAPGGVRARGFRGGPHYLQYSFDRRLFIMNAFLQSLIGLYDYAKITGDTQARSLFEAAEPEAQREVPAFDVGDWSKYSYRGRESDREYHELLREFLASTCSRLRRPVYCDSARRFRDYQTDPAVLDLKGPVTATQNQPTRIRFFVNKRSAVQVVVTRDGDVGLDRTATFRRGEGSFEWRPKSTGTYTIRLAAKELRTGRGLRTRVDGAAEVGAG
ncbi:MAG: D-glucuronyl C5-epimerase family protein, partial [Actinomycetota bacterium]|nr:D-glucuronyl C5-epimerase family protein [Actinomycetota bacterium]